MIEGTVRGQNGGQIPGVTVSIENNFDASGLKNTVMIDEKVGFLLVKFRRKNLRYYSRTQIFDLLSGY